MTIEKIKASETAKRNGDTELKNVGVAYGSDASGLICGYIFKDGGAAQAIDSVTALEWLKVEHDRNKHEFIWLHFSLSNASAEKWMEEHLSLPEHFFETLHEGAGSTRVEQEEDSLIAVINDVIYDFSFDASQIASVWMCVQHNCVISARLQPLRSVDRLRVAVKSGEEFSSPVSLLVHLLRDQADVLQKIERDSASKVDQIEDKLLTGRVNITRETLGALRRLFVRLRRLLAPEPATLFRLLNRPPTWFMKDDARELREATEESSAVLNDLAALQERTKLLQEEIVAHTTEQTNRSVFLLTIVTVLALPINIIAGLFGMNVGGIPLAQEPHGFWIVVVIIAIFAGIAFWYSFKKQRD
jgi:zinc transporter